MILFKLNGAMGVKNQRVTIKQLFFDNNCYNNYQTNYIFVKLLDLPTPVLINRSKAIVDNKINRLKASSPFKNSTV